jgi:hypothetical protein
MRVSADAGYDRPDWRDMRDMLLRSVEQQMQQVHGTHARQRNNSRCGMLENAPLLFSRFCVLPSLRCSRSLTLLSSPLPRSREDFPSHAQTLSAPSLFLDSTLSARARATRMETTGLFAVWGTLLEEPSCAAPLLGGQISLKG